MTYKITSYKIDFQKLNKNICSEPISCVHAKNRGAEKHVPRKWMNVVETLPQGRA